MENTLFSNLIEFIEAFKNLNYFILVTMEEFYFRRTATVVLSLALIVLTFLLLKPLLLSIILGILLAFIFNPVYNLFYNATKMKNLSSGLVCIILISLIIIPIWFLTPILLDQSFKLFKSSQEIDFVRIFQENFPSLFISSDISSEMGAMFKSLITSLTSNLMNYISNFILNFPILFLQSTVVFFTLFYFLRDKEEFKDYMDSLLPFPKEIKKRLFESTNRITYSILYGQVLIGIIQGLIVGIGFFIFNVPNSLLLTFFAAIAGILPVIGTPLIWIPISIYLFISGDMVPFIGVTIFGLISSSIDNLLRPIIISRRTKLNSLSILIGMIGGLFLFGTLGFILGPLIMAYFLTILDVYRYNKMEKIVNHSEKDK